MQFTISYGKTFSTHTMTEGSIYNFGLFFSLMVFWWDFISSMFTDPLFLYCIFLYVLIFYFYKFLFDTCFEIKSHS